MISECNLAVELVGNWVQPSVMEDLGRANFKAAGANVGLVKKSQWFERCISEPHCASGLILKALSKQLFTLIFSLTKNKVVSR